MRIKTRIGLFVILYNLIIAVRQSIIKIITISCLNLELLTLIKELLIRSNSFHFSSKLSLNSMNFLLGPILEYLLKQFFKYFSTELNSNPFLYSNVISFREFSKSVLFEFSQNLKTH